MQYPVRVAEARLDRQRAEFFISTAATPLPLFRPRDGRARRGIPVVIDIDEIYDDSTHELLPLVDYLIASSDFAEDPQELADRYGCPVVGITRGAEGRRVLDRAAN